MKLFIKHHLTILVILLFALLLRLPLLNGSFWLDEAAQAIESSRPLSQQLDLVKDFQPPLFHLLVHLMLYLGQAEWWLRMASLVPALVSIWATYQIGKKLISAKAGLIASILLSTNSYHIFFSQELRPYSLAMMFGILSWYLMVQILAASGKNSLVDMFRLPFTKSFYVPSQPMLLMMYFSCISMGLYTSFIFPFLLLSQVVFVLVSMRKLLAKFIFVWLLAGLSFLPWIPTFLAQLAVGQTWRQIMPGWSSVVSLPQVKALPMVLGKFIFGVIDLEVNTPFIIMTGFLVLLMINSSLWMFKDWRSSKLIKDNSLVLLLCWLIIPLLSTWLVSFVVPVLSPKRVLFLLPSFYLLITYLLQTKPKDKKQSFVGSLFKDGVTQTALTFFLKVYGRLSAWILILMLLLINFYSTTSYWSNPKLQRENWKQLYQQIISKYPIDQTVLVFVFDEPFASWQWYDQKSSNGYQTFDIDTLNVDRVENLRDLLEPITKYRYILVFDYLQDLTDPNRKLVGEISQFGFKQVDLIDQANIGFVRVFAKPDQLLSGNNL